MRWVRIEFIYGSGAVFFCNAYGIYFCEREEQALQTCLTAGRRSQE